MFGVCPQCDHPMYLRYFNGNGIVLLPEYELDLKAKPLLACWISPVF